MEEEVKFPDHTKAVSVLRRDEEDVKLNKYKASNSTQTSSSSTVEMEIYT